MTIANESVDGHIGNDGVRSVNRAFELLHCFDRDTPEWSVRGLTRATGLPKTTVLRLVSTLVKLDLLVQTSDGVLALGAGFLRWGDLAAATWQVPAAAQTVMDDLAKLTRETVNLYVQHGTSRVVVAQAAGTAMVRNAVPIGVPLALVHGAAGRVLLAGSSDTFAAIMDEGGLTAEQKDSLVLRVGEAKRDGYAVTHGERELGASGLAVPVCGSAERVVAALALGGPTPRFHSERVGELLDALREAAKQVSKTDIRFPNVI